MSPLTPHDVPEELQGSSNTASYFSHPGKVESNMGIWNFHTQSAVMVSHPSGIKEARQGIGTSIPIWQLPIAPTFSCQEFQKERPKTESLAKMQSLVTEYSKY